MIDELLVDFSLGVFWGITLSQILAALREVVKLRVRGKQLVDDAKKILAQMEALRSEHHIDPPDEP